MPRDAQGNFTLDPSNPVAPETVISTLWANPTMADIGSEITNSLDRAGRGGMNAPLRLEDGEIFAPSITFQLQPTLGFYRPEDGVLAVVSNSAELMLWSETEVVIIPPVTLTGGGIVISGPQPALPIVGVAQVFGNATNGGVLRGSGNTNDISLQNSAGINALDVPAGTTNVKLNSLSGTGSRQVFAAPDGTLSAPP